MTDSAHDPVRRAAVLIATLDAESAEALLDEIPADDAARVRQMALEMTTVGSDEERAVIGDFLESSAPATNHDVDGPRDAEIELCVSPESLVADASLDDGPAELPPNSFLNVPGVDHLPQLLENERPQTIALVLSRLSESQAAGVLGSLPDRIQADVLRRWAEIDATDPKSLNEIEHELATRVADHSRGGGHRATHLSQVASVVQSAQPALKQQIINNLALYDAPLVARVGSPPLEFDDLAYLSDADLAAVMGGADPNTILLSLAGATESFVERALALLPEAEGKRVRRAIASLGPTRLSDIEMAQRELARLAGIIKRTQ
jgi:flagellar motor switch protein FliG